MYTRMDGNERVLPPLQHEALMSLYYQHQRRLMAAIGPGSLVVDCHSFTASIPNPEDVDICLGWNEDASRPPQALLEWLTARFEAAGYRVGFNAPFSNSISPRMAFAYPSLMLEVNKRIYMDEQRLEKSPDFAHVHALLGEIYDDLLCEP